MGVSFELTDEQREIRDWVHNFAEREIRPVAHEYDEKEEFHNAYVSVHAHLPREDYHWIATIAPGTWLQFLMSTSLPARREEGLWDEMYDEAGRARRWFARSATRP